MNITFSYLKKSFNPLEISVFWVWVFFFFLNVCCIPTPSKSASVLLQTKEINIAFSWVKIGKQWTLTILNLGFLNQHWGRFRLDSSLLWGSYSLDASSTPNPWLMTTKEWLQTFPSIFWKAKSPSIKNHLINHLIDNYLEQLICLFLHQPSPIFCAKIVLRWHLVSHLIFQGDHTYW